MNIGFAMRRFLRRGQPRNNQPPPPKKDTQDIPDNEPIKEPIKEVIKMYFVEVNMVGFLENLGIDIFRQVIAYLNGNEIFSLSQANKKLNTVLSSDAMWECLLHDKFGDCFVPIERNAKICKEVFRRISNLKIPVIPTLSFVWMNDTYWSSKNDETSHSKKIAYLNQVCWLQISGTLQNIPRGKYNVIWRMKMDKDSAFNFNATWSLKEGDVESLVYNWPKPHNEMAVHVNKGWFNWNMGTIVVKNDHASLDLYIIGGNPSWFGGWALDYIQFVPVNNE